MVGLEVGLLVGMIVGCVVGFSEGEYVVEDLYMTFVHAVLDVRPCVHPALYPP